MPELPEVETVKNRLQQVLTSKTISQVKVLREKSFQGDVALVMNKQIMTVSRRAKLLRFHLQDNLNLLIHLKMTGQLIYYDDKQKIGGGHPTADWTRALPSSHTRVIFFFSDGSKLFFNDMRVFGWIKLQSDLQLEQEYQRYGPDANSSEFTCSYLQSRLQNRAIPIKQVIMINEIVAGVGNIYAAEALFLSGIDPSRSSRTLTLKELEKLVSKIKLVLQEGIKHKGTTFDGKYVNVSGLAGRHQDHLWVYGREGEKCNKCETQLEKIKLGGRGTVFCPCCQN